MSEWVEGAGEAFLKSKEDEGATGDYFKTMTRHINVFSKSLHFMPVSEVTQPQIAKLLTDVAEKKIEAIDPATGKKKKLGGKTNRERVRATLHHFFSWCAEEGLLGENPSNPVTHTRKGKTNHRDRLLTLEEMREIWQATADQTDAYNQIVRLLMLTGQRRTQFGSLQESEVWFQGLPYPEVQFGPVFFWAPKRMKTQRQKSTKQHRLPMTKKVMDILLARPEVAGRPLFFGEGKGGFQGWSKAKAALDERIHEARKKRLGAGAEPMPYWVHHDLRHTFSTRCKELPGVLSQVVEAVLHHVSSEDSGKKGVAGIYDHSEYMLGKRDVLEKWEAYIMAEVAAKLPGEENLPTSGNRPSARQAVA